MYFANKIVGYLVSPFGLFWLAALAAFALWSMRRPRAGAALLACGFAWLWLWAMPVTGRLVGVPLERAYLTSGGRVPDAASCPEAAAIVLLGGGMGAETNLSAVAEMFANADRVWHAARLYRAGKAPRVIATGDGARDSTGGLLSDLGVPAEAMAFLDARNTEEEARAVQRLVAGTNAAASAKKPKVLLVTSAWHMRRAALLFGRYAPAVEIAPAPTDFENSFFAARSLLPRDFLPDTSALDFNARNFREWFGHYGYKWLRR